MKIGDHHKTECENLLYLVDVCSKVYKMNLWGKIDKAKNWKNEKLIIWNVNWWNVNWWNVNWWNVNN